MACLATVTELRRLILWDVDGTLVRVGPASLTAFDAAVRAVVGRNPGPHGVQFSGKTDPQIALEILAAMALSDSEATHHLPGVLRALEETLRDTVGAMRRGGQMVPGVREVLSRLAADPSVLQTVVSGNIESNARLKLQVFGLDRWFDFETGAYGSDHHDRDELVPIVLDKLERTRGYRPDPADIWVVGDTPRDLACARAGGTRCLLVATGWTPLEELRDAGADAVFPNLSDTDAVVRVLTAEG
jgi:phosphoglycolate phosphatase